MFATSLLDVFSVLTIDIQVTLQTSFLDVFGTSVADIQRTAAYRSKLILLCLSLTHSHIQSHSIYLVTLFINLCSVTSKIWAIDAKGSAYEVGVLPCERSSELFGLVLLNGNDGIP